MEQQDKELFHSLATHLSQQRKYKKMQNTLFLKTQIVQNHQVKNFLIYQANIAWGKIKRTHFYYRQRYYV